MRKEVVQEVFHYGAKSTNPPLKKKPAVEAKEKEEAKPVPSGESLAQSKDTPIAAAAASVINNEKSAQEPEPKLNKTKEA